MGQRNHQPQAMKRRRTNRRRATRPPWSRARIDPRPNPNRLLGPFYDDGFDDDGYDWDDDGWADDAPDDDDCDDPAMTDRTHRPPPWATAFTLLVRSQAAGDSRATRRTIDDLVGGVGREGSSELSLVVADQLEQAVAACWGRGWQPADLVHVMGRRTKGTHRRLLTDVIALEAQAYRYTPHAEPPWLAQVDAVAGASSLPDRPKLLDHWLTNLDDLGELLWTAAQLMAALRTLPPQPRLCAPPSEWSTATASRASGPSDRPPPSGARSRPASGGMPDPKIMQRVRALLAKAESTHFPDEAEAFTAKAQELVARHAIDQAMLDADHGAPRPAGGGDGRRILIDDPYARAKSLLLAAVAHANHSRCVWQSDMGLCTVFGLPNDLDVVELLFTSLLTQATAAMVTEGRRLDHGGRQKSFRHSFLVAYAGRIGERLEEATASAVHDARAVHGDQVLPVLANRTEAAETARSEAFPRLRKQRISISNSRGWAAGRAAADRARLGPDTSLERGGR